MITVMNMSYENQHVQLIAIRGYISLTPFHLPDGTIVCLSVVVAVVGFDSEFF